MVNLWGGFADEERTRPWTEDIIANIWFAIKAVTSLVALILVDRVLLDLDASMAKY